MVPLPQSIFSTGTATSTTLIDFSPASVFTTAPPVAASTVALTSSALQLQFLMVDPPSTHSLLWGWRLNCSPAMVQPARGTRRKGRAAAANRIILRMGLLRFGRRVDRARYHEDRSSGALDQSGE